MISQAIPKSVVHSLIWHYDLKINVVYMRSCVWVTGVMVIHSWDDPISSDCHGMKTWMTRGKTNVHMPSLSPRTRDDGMVAVHSEFGEVGVFCQKATTVRHQ